MNKPSWSVSKLLSREGVKLEGLIILGFEEGVDSISEVQIVIVVVFN
jgi:hypothetical protein